MVKSRAQPASELPEGVLGGLRVLLVFHSFRQDTDTFAFLTDVKNLGAIPSLNLLYVSAWLRRYGADVTFLDANALELGLPEALERARAIEFDVVAFTVTNLDYLYAIRWIRAFSTEFGRPVLVGGAGVEAYPADFAAIEEITAAFHSPAEACVVQWLDAWMRGDAWWTTPGTACTHDGQLFHNPPALLDKRFVRPLPDRGVLDDHRLYFSLMSKARPFTIGMSVLGCPYPCDFCAVRRSTTHVRTPDDIVDEMEYCEKELGIREIDWFDANYAFTKDRAVRIAELYKKRGLSIRWSARVRVDRVDAVQLRAMKESGCRWLGYGIESGDATVLDNIHKPQGGFDHIRHNLQLTRDAGIEAVGFFVVGLPGEGPDSLANTLRFIETAPLDYVQISPYWPIPRTPIYDAIVRETGLDLWRLVITHGPQDALPLHHTDYSMADLYTWSSKAYREFYFRPSKLLKLASNITSLEQLRRYTSAGLDIVRGSIPLIFGRHE